MVVNVISSPSTTIMTTTDENDNNINLSSLRRRFASLALSCIHREYPNKIAHVLTSDADVQAPRHLTPVFFGCFDWHSAVHGHWLLTRLGRIDKNLTCECRQALRESLTKEKLQGEVTYLSSEQRQAFERPYGLAWLLQLVMELDEWAQEEKESSEEIVEWRENMRSLELIVVNRLSSWLPKLSYPVRSGEHSQTAFALGLSLDYARHVNNSIFAKLIEQHSLRFFSSDKLYPFTYEPSGEDFLSAGLAEADLMRRVMCKNNHEFLQWFNDYLPLTNLPSSLEPPSITDPTDPKLIHLAGLCLSRAWISEEIVEWRENMRSLELIVVNRLSSWLPKLSYPVRSGEHSQTAFALGLSLDYARHVNNSIFAKLIEQHSLRFFSSDKLYPFTYEPSGEDFLSAGLAEADLMRRVMYKNNHEFLQWFNDYLPLTNLPSSLEPPSITDPTDPKLIHLAGLCLSRAWMLEGIAEALPENTEQRNQLYQLSQRNAQAGLTAIDESHYEGGHWLGTFAVYLITRRGINSNEINKP
ncbi:unnamed protein product [Rotaria sp. Silwood2]|nr:unnamed protein product [Rotaria sp. Silwood2]